MDVQADETRELSAACWQEVTRICELWRAALAEHAHLGPYLFGKFSVADCMFAPVVERFLGYNVPVDAICASYAKTIRAHEGMTEWRSDAAGEHELTDP